MSWKFDPKPEIMEKVISAFCYLSCGLVGLLYIIVSGKHSQSRFFRFHFLQSIILGMFSFLLGWIGSAITSISVGIFDLFGAGGPICQFVANGIFTTFDLLGKVFILLALYGICFAVLGKYAEIPILSNLVRQQMR